MNFQFYLEKLRASENFQNFLKENSDAYPCSCFFAVDKQGRDNQIHFDYFVPNIKKMFSFQLEKEMEKVPLELFDSKIPEKISMNSDFDFKDVEELILNRMKKEKIENKIQKMLFSLQKIGKKDFLIGTIFISGLGLLKVNIDISKRKITQFNKSSFLDMMKIIKKE